MRVQGPEQGGAGKLLQAAQEEPGTQDLHLEEQVRDRVRERRGDVQFRALGPQVRGHVPAQVHEGLGQGARGVDQGDARH